MDDLYLAQNNSIPTYSEITNPGKIFRSMIEDPGVLDVEVSSDGRKMSALETFKSQTHATLPDRRLGVTKRGYIGMFPGVVENGDGVFVVAGAGVPFILRGVCGQEGRGEGKMGQFYQLVGDAYVHGVMYGEVLGMEGFKMVDVLLV